jgi:hypothetical protein
MTFAQAIARCPTDVARKHHGRTPAEGFDCAGLPIWLYEQCGVPLDALDLPYTKTGAHRMIRDGVFERQLAKQLRDVTPLIASNQDRDGDIWVFDVGDGLGHLGVFIGGRVWHMGVALFNPEARRVRAHLKRAFRV